ncbi:helix-turn-helix domain-containing protein [Streptomyces sp. NPDC059753]|uniref:helix-turn-helix domain-containing protein n=1 Tax=Streptomyces sp. NPDC059753 TaxID=3346933 RepID=UPI00366390E6
MDFEIREDRGKSRGPRALVREREEYFRLMDQGLTSYDACRIVGINYRTGKRWRNGRNASGTKGTYPAVRRPLPTQGPSRYLRQDDRLFIADRLQERASVRRIAAELGRSPSTISWEIRRNSATDSRGNRHYRPHTARPGQGRRAPPTPQAGEDRLQHGPHGGDIAPSRERRGLGEGGRGLLHDHGRSPTPRDRAGQWLTPAATVGGAVMAVVRRLGVDEWTAASPGTRRLPGLGRSRAPGWDSRPGPLPGAGVVSAVCLSELEAFLCS